MLELRGLYPHARVHARVHTTRWACCGAVAMRAGRSCWIRKQLWVRPLGGLAMPAKFAKKLSASSSKDLVEEDTPPSKKAKAKETPKKEEPKKKRAKKEGPYTCSLVFSVSILFIPLQFQAT